LIVTVSAILLWFKISPSGKVQTNFSVLFFNLYASILLTSIIVLGVNYFEVITHPLHQFLMFYFSCKGNLDKVRLNQVLGVKVRLNQVLGLRENSRKKINYIRFMKEVKIEI